MSDLTKRAIGAVLRFIVGLAALIFLSDWSFHYWQGWLFLMVFSSSIVAITAYLARNDPRLLKSRMEAGPAAEKQGSQRLIQLFATLAFISVFVVSVLDHRFGWSHVPLFGVYIGNALVVIGLYVVFLVFRENGFASGVIEIGSEQTTISTGPYAIVRHPMYFGSLIMLAGIPLALGSLWGLVTLVPFSLLLIWRLIDEEQFLVRNLAGYPEYQHHVPYRLLPFIW
jgi:protein-S-isoprenylcysteine O-methyltransferase Ste14